ncbi:DUF6611 family protein [Mycobacterium sp.]|uniref:DUF6611 family protein n=1 Tax=Mycobacterium sp. TaxID=1785 RepID=UPI002B93E68F|nr:DUF6611 family protein [Mycobacterium sp.]HME49616.1 DUF6611 family protein [Mycobacterium sp.]
MGSARGWSRLIDGEHAWGSFDIRLGRSGFRRYRLTVFPPGISDRDRRLLRLWRGWPIGGVAIWLMAATCLDASSPASTLAVLVSAYLGTGAALFALTAGTRPRVRSMSLTLVKGYGWAADPKREAARRAWEKLTGVMLAAEDMRKRGTLSPVQYEAVWWEIYDRMEAVAELR